MAGVENEFDLLRDAIAGDAPALTALLTGSYETLQDRIARRIPADLRGQLDADDIVQETHVSVFRHIGTFQPEGPTSFERWIHTIGIHKLRKAIRAGRAVKRGGHHSPIAPKPIDDSMATLLGVLEAPGRTPSSSVARLEAIEAVRAAMEQLPDDFRQAVQLVYLQGVPVADAAAAMQRTERAVYNLCFKAKEHLRSLMASRSHYLSSST